MTADPPEEPTAADDDRTDDDAANGRTDVTVIALEAPLDARRAVGLVAVVVICIVCVFVCAATIPGLAIAAGVIAFGASVAALGLWRRSAAAATVTVGPDGFAFSHPVFFDGVQTVPIADVGDIVCGPAAWELAGPPRTGWERSGNHVECGLVRGGGTPNVCIRMRRPVVLERLRDPIARTGGRYETLLPLPGIALERLWLRVPDPDRFRRAGAGTGRRCTWVE